MKDRDITGRLHNRALIALTHRQRGLTLEQIALDIDVPLPWLKDFARGVVPNASVNRVEKVYEYFCGPMQLKA